MHKVTKTLLKNELKLCRLFSSSFLNINKASQKGIEEKLQSLQDERSNLVRTEAELDTLEVARRDKETSDIPNWDLISDVHGFVFNACADILSLD